eukprot:611010-Ditylum_brightwellii.AAC.1
MKRQQHLYQGAILVTLKLSKNEVPMIQHQMRVNMLNFALKYKYSYERWKNTGNGILLKEPRNNKVHKIQVIHIYEADYSVMT